MRDLLLSAPGLFLLGLLFLPVALRSRLPWTPLGGGLLGAAAALALGSALVDPGWRARLLGDNDLPLLLLILLSAALLWREMARLQRPLEERDVPAADVDIFSGKPLWTGVGAIVLVILAAFLLPPGLGHLADPATPPGDAMAPWFLLGFQEVGVYLAPPWDRLLLPGLVALGLLLLPGLETPAPLDATRTEWTARGPRSRVMVFVGGWLLLWLLPAALAAWHGDPHPAPGDATRPFGEWVWSHWLDVPLPHSVWIRELPGLLVLGAWFVGVPAVLGRWRGSRDLLARYRRRLGAARFALATTLLLLLLLIPIKMLLRWTLGVDDLLHLPTWGIRL